MSGSPKNLEAARVAWQALPAPVRRDAARAIGSGTRAASASERLVALLAQRLLERSSERQQLDDSRRERLVELLTKVSSPLFHAPDDGSESAFTGAYARQLLALALPLVADESRLSPERLCALLERTHAHEVLAPLAFDAALAGLANELMKAAGDDLLSKVRELLVAPRRAPESANWMDRPDRLLLSVDHVTLSCARYLAGLQTPERDRYGYDELEAGRAGRTKRVDKVTVRFEPGSELPGTRVTEPGGSELKAKLFVALFALAAEAKSQGRRSPNRVRLRDLLWLMGFELGRATNSDYYWRYAAQVTRYLLIDLPHRVVAMQVSIAGEPEPRVLFEPLLGGVEALDASGLAIRSGRLSGALQADTDEAAMEVRRSHIHGFQFAVSDELLEAHGVGRPLNAIEHVPVEVLSLKGPAFWLAWQVAFLRRWASVPVSGAHGKPLLRAVEESGHLAACTRAGRVRYKDALRNWWEDAGELAGIGLLEEPGVRLYARRGGSWREVSAELSRWLDPGGGRVSRSRLQDIRVLFQIPEARAAHLAEARKRKRGGGSRPGRSRAF